VRLDDAQSDRVRAFCEQGADVATLQTPAELFYAANRWNWDDGLDGPRALLSHPDFPRAAALLLYWNGGYDILTDCGTVEEAEEEFQAGDVFVLLMALEAAVIAGLPTHGIAYDPSNDGGTDWTSEGRDDLVHAVPAVMFDAVDGEAVVAALRW